MENIQKLDVNVIVWQVKNHMAMAYYADETIKLYTRAIKQYVNWCGVLNPATISKKQVAAIYLEMVQGMGLECRMAAKLRNGIGYYYEKLLGYENYCSDIPCPRRTKPAASVISESDLNSLLNANTKTWMHVAINLAAFAGMRLNEISTCEWKDYNKNTKTITIKRAKGGSGRTAYLLPDIYHLMNITNALKGADTNIVATGRSEAVSDRHIQKTFAALREQCGLPKNLTMHSLREFYACRLSDRGVQTATIQKMLGHASIKSTEHYLRGTDSDITAGLELYARVSLAESQENQRNR
jgi:integrase/recombinase XerD